MKFNTKSVITISIVLSIFVAVTTAQVPENKKELEDRHQSLLKEINETQKILSATQEERKVSMSQLKALQNQVQNRQTLINNLDSEIQEVNNDIVSKTKDINDLTQQIDKLKYLYTQSVRYSYKHQSAHNILAFILTADNFNDGMKRYQYMKKNRDFRRHQADQLKTGQKKIENNIKTLDDQKKKNVKLKNTQIDQKKVILEESQLTQQMVDELRGKEMDLTASIEKKRNDARKLDGIIKNIIREEIRITQQKKAEEERKKQLEENKRKEELARIEKQKQLENQRIQDEKNRQLEIERKRIQDEKDRQELLAKNNEKKPEPSTPKTVEAPKPKNDVVVSNKNTSPVNNTKTEPTEKVTDKNIVTSSQTKPDEPPKVVTKPDNPPNYKNSLTPDMQMNSNNFNANKGRLPSPIQGGYISAPYGKYPHPLEPKVTLENMGIDLAGQPGTQVNCVFNGSVTTVVTIAGTYTVIVNHGEYFTVYSNLSSVSVSKGQNISTNQQVGVVGVNDEGEHIVHFEVCRVGPNNSIVNENPSAWIAR